MTRWDWLVVAVPILLVYVVGAKTRKYTRSVADFMAASRVAGRYLVATASAEATFGAVDLIAQFEPFFLAGLTMAWWLNFNSLVWLFIVLSGFIVYRYRESRVMTMAQFFEIRYSKAFRLFAGGLAFLSGILTYGIYPVIGARFFIYFCDIPITFHLAGIQFQTIYFAMAILLLPGILLTVLGGQVTLIVVDSVEGIISMIFRTIVAAVLVYMFAWSDIAQTLIHAPPGKSLVNPFDASQNDFNIWYMVIAILANGYAWQARQAGHGFRSAAINAHEQKMGGILAPWRNEARTLSLIVMCLTAYCFLNHPHYATGAAHVQSTLDSVGSEQQQQELRMPLALAMMMPPGVKGMFVAIMLFSLISTDCTMMHSWGTIFVQDLVVPLRKTPMSTKQHLLVLRLSVIGVGVFAFIFSALFQQTQYILMFFAVMGSIFISGAGSAIIGGFYWKRGTTAGAWGAMIVGGFVTLLGFVLDRMWPRTIYPWMTAHAPDALRKIRHVLEDVFSKHISALNWTINPNHFPFSGQWVWAFAIIAAIAVYVSLSLLTCREPFNLDRMLHRGEYATDAVHAATTSTPRRFSWGGLIGITPEFTRGDKAISISLFSYRMLWFAIFVVITTWNLIGTPWPTTRWIAFWHYTTVLFPFFIVVVCTIWFTWGGLRDLRRLFKILATVERDPNDDGTVVGHHNLDESAAAVAAAIPAGQSRSGFVPDERHAE